MLYSRFLKKRSQEKSKSLRLAHLRLEKALLAYWARSKGGCAWWTKNFGELFQRGHTRLSDELLNRTFISFAHYRTDEYQQSSLPLRELWQFNKGEYNILLSNLNITWIVSKGDQNAYRDHPRVASGDQEAANCAAHSFLSTIPSSSSTEWQGEYKCIGVAYSDTTRIAQTVSFNI